MSRVSFILPAYKRRFLKKAIDSILAQTCRDFELVLVDDKSPEGLYDVVKEYSWEKDFETLPGGGRRWNIDGISVRYYQNAENMGGKDLVAAWNHAMKYATAEWCVLASDDDVYMPEYLAEMLRLQAKYPECDLFHGRVAIIDAEGEWREAGLQWTEFISQVQFAFAKEALRYKSFAGDFMFRRESLCEIGGFIPFPIATYSDDATWLTLSRNGVACSATVLFLWRASGENISTRCDNAIDKLEACEHFRLWFRKFAEGLVSETDEEAFLQGRLLQEAEARIDGLARLVMHNVASLPAWLKVFRKAPQSSYFKRFFIYDKFKAIRAIWMLLPHMRQKQENADVRKTRAS